MWRKPLTIQAVRICWRAGCPIKPSPRPVLSPPVNREWESSSSAARTLPAFVEDLCHMDMTCKAKSRAANRGLYLASPTVAAKSLEIRLRLNGDAGSSLIRFAFRRSSSRALRSITEQQCQPLPSLSVRFPRCAAPWSACGLGEQPLP